MKAGAKIHFILSFFIMSIMVSSCFKKEEYPLEPNISFDKFNIQGDSANVVFNFTDGNGDIGLNEYDTIAPFNIESEFHYNLYINYFEKDDIIGWTEGLDLQGNPIIFKYRIQPIDIKGKTKGVKGKIDVNMGNLYYNVLSNQSDTIKYSIQLIDRDLNKSNIVETNQITQ